jgi:nitrogen fixation protein FixH
MMSYFFNRLSIPFLFPLALAALLIALTACGTPKEHNHADHWLTINAKMAASPVTTGEQILEIELKDKEGNGVTGATVKVKPHMPAHGHGSSKESTVQDEGSGKYKATVMFQMPGAWEIRIDAVKGEEHGDTKLNVTVE